VTNFAAIGQAVAEISLIRGIPAFKMAAVRHLGFIKFDFWDRFLFWRSFCIICQISWQLRSNRCRDGGFSISRNGGCRLGFGRCVFVPRRDSIP